ncbi:MAG: alpha/beta fold hydrolase [Pseudomonadota bacterium]
MQEPQILNLSDDFGARDIATLHQSGATPGVMWMQGFRSDMISTKAAALAEWASETGTELTRFDYSAHGQSSGVFEEATLSQWLADCVAVHDAHASGPAVLVGSSMGGYLTMLLHDALPTAPHAIVLIAPAWDMTEALIWNEFTDEIRNTVMTDGVWLRPSAYGDPYPITRRLIEDGRKHLYANKPWRPRCPVRIIHGRLDPDVPFEHGEALVEMIKAGDQSADVRLLEVPDGEHRLSRPEDVALLIQTIEAVRCHPSA